MAKVLVNTGTTPNDGTGDPIRVAMNTINGNFDEIYSAYTMTGALTVGNSTVNTIISNTGGVRTGNSTANAISNSTIYRLSNTTANSYLTPASLNIGANVAVNTSAISLGNSIANSVYNNGVTLSNSTSSSVLTTGSLFVGNATVNATANSSRLTIASANLTTNTGLILGSSTDAANGYTFLPNGFKLNWGWVSANNTDGVIVFTSAYTTNVYAITPVSTSNSTFATQAVSVLTQNNTVAQVRTANALSTNVYWSAIGK